MKKVIVLIIGLLLAVNLQSCTSTPPSSETKAPVQNSTMTSEEVMTKYFAFNQKYENSGITNLSIDMKDPAANQEKYNTILNLKTEAESIRQDMNTVLTNTSDYKGQAQLKPLLPILEARIASLANLKASFESFGGI